jgi:hypothetical protein
MSQAIVGRIFWKELRVQRAFWAWILGLGAVIQFLPVLLGREYYQYAVHANVFQSIDVVMACCFAAGSAAIAFAGETEARTKLLFQRLPVRSAELLLGKLGWSFLATYALYLLLMLTGGLWSGEGLVWASHKAGARFTFDLTSSTSWISLFWPLPFLLFGVLCSLTLRDVLTTVTVAGVGTAVFFSSTNQDNWLLACCVGLAVVIGDVLLLPQWLRDSAPASWSDWLPRIGRLRTAREHSTLSVRSPVAWRRAASSLLWKEWRQAIGLTLLIAGAGAVVVGLTDRYGRVPNQVNEWLLMGAVCLTTVPILFGVAAGHADRRDNAYRLLANRGVSPNAYWLLKHVVWLGLAMGTLLFLMGWEQVFLKVFPSTGVERPFLWEMARSTVETTFHLLHPGVLVILAMGLFSVLLLYALGHALSLAIPSAMTALVVALIGWLIVAALWTVGAAVEIPFWWTIGVFPLILLFAGWLRTRDWLVDRNSLSGWGRVALSVVVPFFLMFCGIAAFRVVQVPTVTLPIEIQTPQPLLPGDARSLEESQFVAAIRSLSGPPPHETSAWWTTGEGWAHASAETRTWVERNEKARQLALDAVGKPPGDFPSDGWIAPYRSGVFNCDGVMYLVTLLLDSARRLESEDRLEEALGHYVAVARLGDDLERSNRIPSPPRIPSTQLKAIEGMDRWAAHPKQRAELIKQVITLFQRFEEDAPSDSITLLRDWRLERELFEDYVWKGNNPNERNRTTAETGIVRWCLPWELLRLQRVQDAIFSRSLDKTQIVERDLRDRGFVDPVLITSDRLDAPWKFERTTLEPPNEAPGAGMWLAGSWRVNHAALARLHFLAWAAADYRRVHHKLPDRLQNLVPQYFAWLPVDPWNGRDFLYEPKGVPMRMKSWAQLLDRDEPFIASGGESNCRIEINPKPSPGAPPVRIITPTGSYPNENLSLQEPIDFPSPVVPIPSDGTVSSNDSAHPRTNHSGSNKLFGKPAPKRPRATDLPRE